MVDVNSNKQVEIQTRLIFQMYIKFKGGQTEYALNEVFKEAGLANEDESELIAAFQFVRKMPQMFSIIGTDDPTIDSTFRVSVDPFSNSKIIGMTDGILSVLTTLPNLDTAQKVNLEEIMTESDELMKIKSLSIFLTTNAGLNLSGN